MSRGLPGAEQAVLARVIARLDEIDTTVVQLHTDVERLTRATSSLTDTIRKLPTSNRPDAAEASQQRDWLTVSDADEAEQWLVEVLAWWEAVGDLLSPGALPCWPWHPLAVTAALALQAHYVEAYAGDKASPVSDLVTRWAPALGHLIIPRSYGCDPMEHRDDRHGWTVHRDLLPDYARWWATDRTGTPPGLTVAG